MLPLLAAGAAAIPSIFQGITGMIQAGKGRRMAANNVRPIYERPTEARTALALSENELYNGVMPGSSQYKNDIGSAAAMGVDAATQAATSGNDVLDAITKINYNQGKQLGDLQTEQAQYKDQQLENYNNQLRINAGYSDKEFGYNKDQPYQDNAAAASALIEGGNTNVGNGIGGLATLGTSLALNGATSKNASGGFDAAAASFKPKNPTTLAPFNYTAKKIVYDPYQKKVSSGV